MDHNDLLYFNGIEQLDVKIVTDHLNSYSIGRKYSLFKEQNGLYLLILSNMDGLILNQIGALTKNEVANLLGKEFICALSIYCDNCPIDQETK